MNTNVLDTSLFTDDSVEVQEDLNQFRNNSILAFRGDVEYDLGVTSLAASRLGDDGQGLNMTNSRVYETNLRLTITRIS